MRRRRRAAYLEARGEAPGVRRETMSGGGGDEMNGRWGLVGGRRKGPFVAAALSFRRRAALQETSARALRRWVLASA